MEKINQENSDGIKEDIANIINKALKDKFPKEELTNSMTIGVTPKLIGIRKNNFRRYVSIDLKTNSGLDKIKTTIDSTKELIIKSYSDHTKLLTVVFEGVLIQLGKKTIVAIYEQDRRLGGEKFFLKKEVHNIEEARKFISDTIEDTRLFLDERLSNFCKKFGLSSSSIGWMRSEKGYFGDRFFDVIPVDTIFHSPKLRKVYESEVEGLSGKDEDATVDAVSFYENRLKEDWFVKDILPVFVSRIDKIEDRFGRSLDDLRVKALEPLTNQIRLHLRVQEETLLVQKDNRATMRLIRKELKRRNDEREVSVRLSKVRELLRGWGW